MNMAAEVVSAFFESQDTKAKLVREDVIAVSWNFSGGSVTIFFQFDESSTHVHLEGVDFIKVPQDKFDLIYKTLNEVNDAYKHVKFVLDVESGEINARDDDIIQIDSCGEECFELMIRMVKIIEDAFPRFMKALYV